jgi:hypothetical protein
MIERKGEVCSLYVFEKISPAQSGAGRFEVSLFSRTSTKKGTTSQPIADMRGHESPEGRPSPPDGWHFLGC